MEEWFASLNSQQETFSGAIELARVATNWKDAYPDKLQRAILRDEVVERLEPLILGETKTASDEVPLTGVDETAVPEDAMGETRISPDEAGSDAETGRTCIHG